jgi:hypothetical protein
MRTVWVGARAPADDYNDNNNDDDNDDVKVGNDSVHSIH